jgi:hypothetical protein
MAAMDLRLVVGGLLTRNTVLNGLLLNYADGLEQECFGHGTATATCFIVPRWTSDRHACAPLGSQVLTVEAHTPRDDPSRHENLDIILSLLHAVLTDDHASASVISRRLETSPGLAVGDRDTVFRVGTWVISPARSQYAGTARPRLVPWPDATMVTRSMFLAPGTLSMN